MSFPSSALVDQFLQEIVLAGALGPVLDLACGGGRNGRAVLAAGANVEFADRNEAVLEALASEYRTMPSLADAGHPTFWPVDLEVPDTQPLAGRTYGAILVFRYLHRPLFPAIRSAIAPGGLVVYETFTVDQPRFGRPTNPDFLLRSGELQAYFDDWQCLHAVETVLQSDDGQHRQAVAQCVARKPR